MKNIIFIFLLIPFFCPTDLSSQELEIYSLYKYPDNGGFISLTDQYPFHKYEDSSVIADEYLHITDLSERGYHKLSDENRKTFLRRMGITRSDTLFIYNYLLDTLVQYEVEDIKLIAVLSPYGNQPPPHPYYYMIGFEIDEKEIEIFGDSIYNSFVYIGEGNPFIKGGLKAIEWEEIGANLFPTDISSPIKKVWFDTYSKGEVYKHETKQYRYFLQNLNFKDQISARHLVIVELSTDSVVLNKIYNRGEGTGLSGIALKGEKRDYPIAQWTGELFRNKPSVVFGFLYHSFGCPGIDFLSEEEGSIYIRCDNRH